MKPAARPLPFPPPAAPTGDVLIQRRAEGRCLTCGRAVPAPVTPGSEQAWLCAACAAARPRRPRFDAKAERQAGLAHLDRLMKE